MDFYMWCVNVISKRYISDRTDHLTLYFTSINVYHVIVLAFSKPQLITHARAMLSMGVFYICLHFC